MYFDDLELDLNLDNSFDALVEDELGQEIDVQVDIPASTMPTAEEIEVIEKTGIMPTKSGLPGQAGRKRIDPIPQIVEMLKEAREGAPGKKPKKKKKKPTVISLPSPSGTGEFKSLEREMLVDDIVKNLTQRLLPRLKKMDKRLKYAANQAKATDEHNIIMERNLFRQDVIGELKHLSQLLPSNHPVRRRINSL
jgi:hypothetical protein